MRSRVATLSLLVLSGLALPRCENQDSRIFDVCATLERCTGYVDDKACGDVVRAAIDDRRLTTSAVARCAQCLGDHAPEDGASEPDCDFQDAPRTIVGQHAALCGQVLNDRVCDAACADVPFVLRTRTSIEMRHDMCAQAAYCGDSKSLDRCLRTDMRQLSCRAFETQLDTDAIVDACRACIVKPGSSTPTVHPTEGRADQCQLIVTACSETCRKAAPSEILTTAQRVLDVCKVKSCFGPADGDGTPVVGSGGAADDGRVGAGGAASAGPEQPLASGGDAGTSQPCFEAVLHWLTNADPSELVTDVDGEGGAPSRSVSPQLRLFQCASCVAEKDCDSVRSSCRDLCQGLPLKESQ